MESYDKELVTPFDMLTSPKSLRMMKLVLPYTNPQMQQMFAVYIRFMELQETMRFYQNFSSSLSAQDIGSQANLTDIISDLAPYLPPEISEAMEQFEMVMAMMENMQDMQEGVDTE